MSEIPRAGAAFKIGFPGGKIKLAVKISVLKSLSHCVVIAITITNLLCSHFHCPTKVQ